MAFLNNVKDNAIPIGPTKNNFYHRGLRFNAEVFRIFLYV